MKIVTNVGKIYLYQGGKEGAMNWEIWTDIHITTLYNIDK